MNTNIIRDVVFFIGGATIGTLVTYKLLKDKYAKIAQEEIDSVKEKFSVEKKEGSELNDEFEVPEVDVSKGGNSYDYAKAAYNDISKAKWRTLKNEVEEDDGPPTDAAGCYEGDLINVTTSKDMTSIDRSEPYVIDDSQFADEFEHHDKISLYYYQIDDVLCDEHEEIIDDIDDTVGWDVFKLFETQTTGWVRNERIGADFEICAVPHSYAQVVHGVGVDDNLSPRERYTRQQKRREINGEE